MFAERFNQALALKSRDVEEFVDVYFHRRLAAAVTALLQPLPVIPNQVTLGGLVTGWIGAGFLFRGFFVDSTGPASMWLLAGLFLFLSVVLDCADGQLARARGGGSRVGRILDGFVDVLVLFPTYVILGFGINELYGTTWFVIAAVAGFSTWIHCVVYDKLKNLYLARTKPGAGGADGTETVADVRADLEEASRNGSYLERFLLWVYLGYLQVQERFASGSTETRADARTPEQIEAFRRRHRSTMRLGSGLGLGTHMLIIYGGVLLMAVNPVSLLVMQVLFATVFNGIMVVVLWRARRFDEAPQATAAE